MKKELVVKDNALINASYHLSLVEQRLILLAIVEARKPEITADSELSVHASAYAKQFRVTQEAAYLALKEACKNLFERRFSYQRKTKAGKVETVVSRWVQYIVYDESATVRIAFAKPVVPLITQLEKHFTSYELEQVSGLSSAYAVRLYELLIAWRSQEKTPVIELQEFRNRLGVLDAEYSRIERLKTSVLKLALHQINAHTDITVTYEQHKRGRVIVGFSFKFKHKKPKGTQTAKNTGDNTAKKKPRQTTTKTLRSRLEKSGIAL